MKINLTSPKWQGIGVLIGIVGSVASLGLGVVQFLSTHNSASLCITVTPTLRSNMSVSKGVDLSYVVNGASVKDLTLVQCVLQNNGGRAISSSDFAEPIRVKCGNNYKLLAIADNAAVAGALQSEWTSPSSGIFELKPVLLNPGDSMNLLLIITGVGKSLTDTFDVNTDLVWSGRIVGVPRFKIVPNVTALGGSILIILFNAFIIVFVGWRMYAFLFGSLIVFAFTTLLFVKGSERYKAKSVWVVVHVTILLLFSLSTTEIILFISAFGAKSMADMVCYPLVTLHFLYLIYLFIPLRVFLKILTGTRSLWKKSP